ncbi:hypothetical protein CVS40_11332 [Lucilia cuprina]|nr:hypothetical protein CVS40_11332 [Lucilia cuprina]
MDAAKNKIYCHHQEAIRKSFCRVPAKSYFTRIEMRSAQNVIFPILIAERDREYLKQLRRNRDEEAKLMANVPL